MSNSVLATPVASELRVVLGRLTRRLRAERRLPLTQAAVLGRLDREGPQCIGGLAAAERVRPQSMSQTLGELEAEGYLTRRPDERDGRRTVIALTDAGRAAIAQDRADPDGWLARAIASGFSEEELEVIERAMPLLARLSEM